MDVPEIVMSPLSRTIERDDIAVEVSIYQDGEGGWILEVEDRFMNSTVWDQPFKTDQDALEEAVRAIYSEGIDSFSNSGIDEAVIN